jgi:hypothetical protein
MGKFFKPLMRNFLLFFFVLPMCVLLTYCRDQGKDKVIEEDTPVILKKDTVGAQHKLAAEDDCNNNFFRGLPGAADSTALKLQLKSGRQVTWKQFVNDELLSTRVKSGFKTIDNDTIPEFIVLNNTGGAHCCEEVYIFTGSNNQYTQKAKLYGGFVCIDPQTNIFTFSFSESLGYFFSCYSCVYRDSTDQYMPLREIELRFHNGSFAVVPYNADVERQIRSNLALLKANGFVELDAGLMDNGWRKEFAMNLAVWHFNHGKNWEATKKQFEQYYAFKDADRVWGEFYKVLNEAGKENSF